MGFDYLFGYLLYCVNGLADFVSGHVNSSELPLSFCFPQFEVSDAGFEVDFVTESRGLFGED